MPRPADRHAKIELLRAAEATFVEHGLAAARVEDITARAGVSKGAFYLHFESKEDCFRQIIEGFLARLSSTVEPDEETLSLTSLPEIRAVWEERNREVFEFCWQNRGLLGMIMGGGGGAPFAYLIDEFAEGVAKQTERSVRTAQAAGLYRADIDAGVIAAVISGAYDRLARELIKQPKRPDIEAWSGQVLDLLLTGLLSSESAEGATRRAAGPHPGAPKVTDLRVKIARRRKTKAAAGEGSPGESPGKTGVGAR